MVSRIVIAVILSLTIFGCHTKEDLKCITYRIDGGDYVIFVLGDKMAACPKVYNTQKEEKKVEITHLNVKTKR